MERTTLLARLSTEILRLETPPNSCHVWCPSVECEHSDVWACRFLPRTEQSRTACYLQGPQGEIFHLTWLLRVGHFWELVDRDQPRDGAQGLEGR